MLDTVFEVSWTADQKHLLAAGGDQAIRMWDISSGRVRHTLTGHTGKVSPLWHLSRYRIHNVQVCLQHAMTLLTASSFILFMHVGKSSGRVRHTVTGHTGKVRLIHCRQSSFHTTPSTVHSRCKDTRCKDNLDVRTAPLVTSHCILTAVVPLSKEDSMKRQIFW